MALGGFKRGARLASGAFYLAVLLMIFCETVIFPRQKLFAGKKMARSSEDVPQALLSEKYHNQSAFGTRFFGFPV
jgi:hypothetical protein